MFDLAALGDALAARGAVARVVVAELRGSAPREVGAAMLVWPDGQAGTIGGGALEYRAAEVARAMLAGDLGAGARVERVALGPDLGQCCGGAVVLVTEVFRALPLALGAYVRPLNAEAAAGQKPLAMARIEGRARRGVPVGLMLQGGWLAEPLAAPRAPVWIWGAGHVGRALVSVLQPLPDLAVTWVDSDLARFPQASGAGLRLLPVPDMPRAVALAPPGAHHVIVTFSHALDLALCDGLLRRGFASCGLIGSASKWARFRARLLALGHGRDQILRIDCPIGDPSLGKHPQAIAIGVAARMMGQMAAAGLSADGRKEAGNG